MLRQVRSCCSLLFILPGRYDLASSDPDILCSVDGVWVRRVVRRAETESPTKEPTAFMFGRQRFCEMLVEVMGA